jgi:hypothetical protein
MTAVACPIGFDADSVARALVGDLPAGDVAAFRAHLAACKPCRRLARTTERMKGAWRAELERDDVRARTHREHRLSSGIPAHARRASRGTPFTMAFVGALAGAAVAGSWFNRHPPAPPVVVPAVTSTASPPAASAAPTAPSPAPSARSRPAAVALVASGPVDVPRGSRLTLNWMIADGHVDPDATLDVEGPASLVVTDSRVLLTRGAARVQAVSLGEVDGGSVRTRGSRATWRIEILGDRTRVSALRGEVVVEGLGRSPRSVTVGAGDSVDVRLDGSLVGDTPTPARAEAPESPDAAAPETPPPPASDDDLWALAQAALRAGDRPGAESAFRTLAAGARNRGLRDRSSFALAELELARGERDAARGRLVSLVSCPDPSLAADAAFLLARSSPGAEERAEVWKRFLDTSPPSPYREQAMVERASALLDAGDAAGARALVAALRAESKVPDVARAALGRLEARLAR